MQCDKQGMYQNPIEYEPSTALESHHGIFQVFTVPTGEKKMWAVHRELLGGAPLGPPFHVTSRYKILGSRYALYRMV
jgi:hypothetical protein